MHESKSAAPGAKSHWDLCVSGELVLLAYHRCEAEGDRVPAAYSPEARGYECSNCHSTHSTFIERGDYLFTPSVTGSDSPAQREPATASV